MMSEERKQEIRKEVVKDNANFSKSLRCLAYTTATSTLAYLCGADELHTFLGGIATYTTFKSLPTLNNFVDVCPEYVKSTFNSAYIKISEYQSPRQQVTVRVEE